MGVAQIREETLDVCIVGQRLIITQTRLLRRLQLCVTLES
jgi:hypothetical protein